MQWNRLFQSFKRSQSPWTAIYSLPAARSGSSVADSAFGLEYRSRSPPPESADCQRSIHRLKPYGNLLLLVYPLSSTRLVFFFRLICGLGETRFPYAIKYCHNRHPKLFSDVLVAVASFPQSDSLIASKDPRFTSTVLSFTLSLGYTGVHTFADQLPLEFGKRCEDM